jgi:hypothetical protein
MIGPHRKQGYGLEGQSVSVALANGSRIDEAMLVSLGRSTARTVWLYSNGADVFVPVADIVDLWQPVHRHDRAA